VFSHIYTGDEMHNVNVTISVPEDLHRRMKEHDEVSWSATIRNVIEQKLRDIELMDKLANKSKLTEEDVRELAEKIDRTAAKKLGLI
jgi:predicted CopG family antitoxin